jgi:uncharacterized protein YukE
MSDNQNVPGFTTGSDGGIIADPSTDPGSIHDYDSWDWKHIEAAIKGTAATPDQTQSVAEPQSLQDAANVFYQVQTVLQGVAQALGDQAKALAGDNGPWKGDAADSFLTMIETFSKQVNATAEVLSGGSTGFDSVPQQLADNAVNLQNAQQKISDIDSWYANQAIKMGVTPMSNGYIPISQKPQLVEWMTRDMRAVLKSLASEYQVTIDSVHSPGAITSPLGNSNQPPTDTNQPDLTANDIPADAPFSRMPATGTLDPNGLNADQFAADQLNPANGSQFPGLSESALSPYSGGTGTGGAGNLDALKGLNDPTALDRALNPFSGGTGTGGTGSLNPLASGLLPTAFGGGTNTGGTGRLGTGEGLSTENPATWKSAEKGTAFPGDTGTGGLGALSKLNAGTGSPYTGGLSTEGGVPAGLKTASLESALPTSDLGSAYPGATGVGGTGAAGEGMPYLPGMGGGASSAQPHGAGGERSDASGLLDANGEPWAGSTNLGEDIGHHLGTTAGGEGLALPNDQLATTPAGEALTGEGMPYLPGMGGSASSAQPHGAGGERSDASGLLEAAAEPWTGEPGVGEQIGGPEGAAAGGEGLTLPGGETAGAEGAAATEATATGEPLPFLPGTGGASAAARSHGGNDERSDASGLLEPAADPWTAEPGSTEPEVHATDPGGDELVLPGIALPLPQPVAERPAEEPAKAAPVQAEEVAVWTAEPETDDETAFAEVELAAPTAPEAAPAAAVDEDSAAAWDTTGATFVPLLWAVPTEEEQEVLAPGYAAAEEGTWGESPLPAPAAEAEEEPRFATWRPNRTAVPDASLESAVVYRSGAGVSCGVGEFAEEAPEEDEPEPVAEEAPSRGAADLLVQEGDTWGVAADDDFGAII